MSNESKLREWLANDSPACPYESVHGVLDECTELRRQRDELRAELDAIIASLRQLTTSIQMCCDGSSDDKPEVLCARRVDALLERAEKAERERDELREHVAWLEANAIAEITPEHARLGDAAKRLLEVWRPGCTGYMPSLLDEMRFAMLGVHWCSCGQPWKLALGLYGTTEATRCHACTLREMLHDAERERDEARAELDAAAKHAALVHLCAKHRGTPEDVSCPYCEIRRVRAERDEVRADAEVKVLLDTAFAFESKAYATPVGETFGDGTGIRGASVFDVMMWAVRELRSRAGSAERKPPEPLPDGPAPGLYRKFRVERVDGRSAVGQKHQFCDYLVLDWVHDPFAIPAGRAYADACAATHPELAEDVRRRADKAERMLRESARTEAAGVPVHVEQFDEKWRSGVAKSKGTPQTAPAKRDRAELSAVESRVAGPWTIIGGERAERRCRACFRQVAYVQLMVDGFYWRLCGVVQPTQCWTTTMAEAQAAADAALVVWGWTMKDDEGTPQTAPAKCESETGGSSGR